jgi:hypothetical protein
MSLGACEAGLSVPEPFAAGWIESVAGRAVCPGTSRSMSVIRTLARRLCGSASVPSLAWEIAFSDR